jgi:hypothetical protein
MMLLMFQVLTILLINITRSREAGMPNLSWNWTAEQQRPTPATRCKATA